MLWNAMLFYDILAMLSYAKLRAMLCYPVLFRITLYNYAIAHAVGWLCCVVLCYTVLCYAMLSYVYTFITMLSYAM